MEVTPIPKAKRYRRQPRTTAEMETYERNIKARMSFAQRRCEAALPRVCTGTATEPHHVYPQRLGRDDSFENLRMVCPSCNGQIETLGQRSAMALGLYSPHPLGIFDPDPEPEGEAA